MKTIKNRKMLYGILSLMLVVVMTFATSTSVFAASGSKKVIASRKTEQIKWGGAIVGGNILKIGTKTYSKPYITVYWDDTL